MNQIEQGLIAEALVQVTLAMGDMAEQEHVFEAKANLKKTWEDMLKTVNGIDRDQPL